MIPFATANEDPLVKGLKASENLTGLYARTEGHDQSSLRPRFLCSSDLYLQGTLPVSADHAMESAVGNSMLRDHVGCDRRSLCCSGVGHLKRALSRAHITGSWTRCDWKFLQIGLVATMTGGKEVARTEKRRHSS